MKKKLIWIIFAGLCLLISLYPISYLIFGDNNGVLTQKSPSLLEQQPWKLLFYVHILFGGLALSVGWSQFNSTFRKKKIKLHRTIGKIYLVAVAFSGLAAVYISFWATGGIVARIGFLSLALVWLLTSHLAYRSIRVKDIAKHQRMMTYSYAACFAAVTLRIWLPLLVVVIGDFIPAYRIVAWLCWVPNLMVAHWLVRRNSMTT